MNRLKRQPNGFCLRILLSPLRSFLALLHPMLLRTVWKRAVMVWLCTHRTMNISHLIYSIFHSSVILLLAVIRAHPCFSHSHSHIQMCSFFSYPMQPSSNHARICTNENSWGCGLFANGSKTQFSFKTVIHTAVTIGFSHIYGRHSAFKGLQMQQVRVLHFLYGSTPMMNPCQCQYSLRFFVNSP